jgi:hypothetical protein
MELIQFGWMSNDNALALSDLANFRVVDPEAVHFDVVEVAPSRFVGHPSCDGHFPVLISSCR